MEYARSMLAELMGPLEQAQSKHFTDDDVCKNYLVAFCPNELFTNTKSDLGICTKLHLPRLKEAYDTAPTSQTAPLGYESKFYEYLYQLVSDLDKRIKRGRERLDAKPDDSDEKVEKVIMLDERVKALLNQVEAFAEEGKVDEAAELTKQVDVLQSELQSLKESEDTNPIFKQEKRMQVCETCGAFLVTNDTSNRLELHLEGKQHVGYKRIREALEELERKHPDWRGGRAVHPTHYGTTERNGNGHYSGSGNSYGRDDYRRRDYSRDRGGRDSRDSRDKRGDGSPPPARRKDYDRSYHKRGGDSNYRRSGHSRRNGGRSGSRYHDERDRSGYHPYGNGSRTHRR